jgi:hypothetical protein
MSWFKHKPPKHPPTPKHHPHPHRSSPAGERAMQETKLTSPKSRDSKQS